MKTCISMDSIFQEIKLIVSINEIRLLTALLALILLTNCAEESKFNSTLFSDSFSGEVSHPVEEFMPSYNRIKKIPSFGLSNKNEFKELLKVYKEAPLLFTIGTSEGVLSEMFGDITDMDTDSAGNIYVIDDRTASLKKYNSQGQLVYSYSERKGKGPDDLFKPAAIAISKRGLIYVADAFSQIKIFRPEADSIVFQETFITPEIIATDICILEDDLFIRTVAKNKLVEDSTVYNTIHVYSLVDNTYKNAFGEIYKSPRISTNLAISGGLSKIACIESTGTVAYNYQSFPYIFAYTSDGQLKWISDISENFKKPELIETVQNGIALKWSYNFSGSRIQNIIEAQNKIYLTVNTSRPEGEMGVNTRGFILSSETGEGVISEADMPWVLHINKEHIYTKYVEKDIQLKVHAFKQ